ncbi:hypothetical protein [Oligoflexus tunisiensis]|uniref:hypothetical protein n=1 Tax=Oligoflexus tunisiensis TaxID=708132 RepID=UPI00114CEBBC|nr:hypothetical protein [Oligoflexus tunisiensis]
MSTVCLVLSATIIVFCIAAYIWQFRIIREDLSVRDFAMLIISCIVSLPTFLGSTPSDWMTETSELKAANCLCYFFFTLVIVVYILTIRKNIQNKRVQSNSLSAMIDNLRQDNNELHESLHNYFHPHLQGIYDFFYEYGNGATPPDFDWGYRRLNLFLFDSENRSILNLSRFCSEAKHEIPTNRSIPFDPEKSYVSKIFNVRGNHTDEVFELDPAWHKFRRESRSVERIKFVCGYEIPIRDVGTNRKSFLLLFEFEKFPTKYLHPKAPSLMKSFINDSKFPQCLFTSNQFTSLSTLIEIGKNWPNQRKQAEHELRMPTFRLRASYKLGKANQRAKATILKP